MTEQKLNGRLFVMNSGVQSGIKAEQATSLPLLQPCLGKFLL